jgi:hypothetical protein
MKVLRRIEQAGHLYPYFDYSHGYGVPLAGHVLQEADTIEPKFTIEVKDSLYEGQLIVRLKQPPPKNRKTYLFYHIAASDGRLKKYAVVEAHQRKVLSLDVGATAPVKGALIRFHYEGYTQTYRY